MNGISSIILVLLMSGFQSSQAQITITDLSIGGKFAPSAGYTPPLDSAKQNGSSIQRELSLHANLLLSRKFDTSTKRMKQWTASIGAHYISLSNSGYSSSLLPSSLLTSYIGVQYFRTLRKNWSLIALVSGGVNSDLVHIDERDLFLNAGLIGLNQFSKTFSMGFGLVVHNSFGTPLVWPAVLVNWTPGGRYRLDIRVPDNGPGLSYKVGLSYNLKNFQQLELAFKPSAMTYDVERAPALKDFRLMSFWQLPIGLEWQHQKNKCRFFAGAGLLMLRSYAFGEKQLSKMFKKYPYHGMAAQGFFNAGVSIKFN